MEENESDVEVEDSSSAKVGKSEESIVEDEALEKLEKPGGDENAASIHLDVEAGVVGGRRPVGGVAEEEVSLQMELSTVAMLQNPVLREEAEEALRINEELRAFIETHQRSYLVAYAYHTKTFLRLVLGLVFTFMSIKYIMREDFDFDFPCDLTDFHATEKAATADNLFYCVNVTAMFSKMLVIGALVAFFVNILMSFVGVLFWHTGMRALPRALTRYGERVGDSCLSTLRDLPVYNDTIFMLFLLQQTNQSLFQCVLDFSTMEFHYELLEFLSNAAWPLERLQSVVRPPPATQILKLIDEDLILAPPAIRHMQHLVEIDLSSNNNLFQVKYLCGLRNLRVLTLRCCDLRSLDQFFGVKTLVKLDVTNNRIRQISEGVVELDRLRMLMISRNKLEVLPSALLEMPALHLVEAEERLIDSVDLKRDFFQRHPFNRGAFIKGDWRDLDQERVDHPVEVSETPEEEVMGKVE